jgi:hypothetical protein
MIFFGKTGFQAAHHLFARWNLQIPCHNDNTVSYVKNIFGLGKGMNENVLALNGTVFKN